MPLPSPDMNSVIVTTHDGLAYVWYGSNTIHVHEIGMEEGVIAALPHDAFTLTLPDHRRHDRVFVEDAMAAIADRINAQ